MSYFGTWLGKKNVPRDLGKLFCFIEGNVCPGQFGNMRDKCVPLSDVFSSDVSHLREQRASCQALISCLYI